MDFETAIQQGFLKFAEFSGRATRSEYWYWMAGSFLMVIGAIIVDFLLGTDGLAQSIAAIALFLPGLSVSVRRLHDIDKSGWWLLLNIIPLIGTIILFVWNCTKGTYGHNRFGPDPLA